MMGKAVTASLLLCFLCSVQHQCFAFSLSSPIRTLSQVPAIRPSNNVPVLLKSTVSADEATSAADASKTLTVFDFTGEGEDDSVASFERIDDAIMGGISLSALKATDQGFASWAGVCRIDGGGFCGMRTLPFKEPLNATGVDGTADGIFVDCRLASDDEPERRVWKLTLRTDSSRGEMVYQAAFPLLKESSGEGAEFARVKVPFNDFQLVRGPRVVPNAPKANVTGGIYQIGLSMSKFVIGVNTTELEGFRPGFFDLHLRRIGFYSGDTKDSALPELTSPVKTLTKKEVEKNRPLLLKVLLPVAKLFFSEKGNRRKSAMKILKNRGMSRSQAILWGIRSRANSKGIMSSLATTAGIFSIDTFRFVVGNAIRLCIFYPLRAAGTLTKLIKKYVFRMKIKGLPKMTE